MPVDLVLEPLTVFLSVVSGIVVGFSLGLVGGGGSVLAVPLLLYVVGVKDTHAAIGTSSLAIGIIAATSLVSHRKSGNLDIGKGVSFALPGVAGTLLGSQFGLWTSPKSLLVLFALFMVAIGIVMLRQRLGQDQDNRSSKLAILKKNLSLSGFSVGLLAGYFGIGGGFLIVPAMMYSGGLSIVQAIGTSLVSVSSFGIVTATRYFVAGHVDIMITILFVIGGIFGSYIGIRVGRKIHKENLVRIFSVLLFGMSAYVLFKTVM
jgi:uncharacterized membrane protein YfcA